MNKIPENMTNNAVKMNKHAGQNEQNAVKMYKLR